MTLRANQRPLRAEHTHLGPVDLDEQIRVTVAVRRRLDHAPIPSFDDYVGCPERKRLSEEEFAEKYGASEDDLQKVVAHYEFFGFTCGTHAGSRHVYLEGSVELVNEAFGVELHSYEADVDGDKHRFHKYEGSHFIPDHLDEIAVHVAGLDTEQHVRPLASTPNVENLLTPTIVNAVYKFPAGGAAGQVIGIPRLNGWGTFHSSGLTETNSLWGSPIPTVTQITIDAVNAPGTSTEINMDVGLCQIFAPNAQIVIYDTASVDDFINRILHPQAGEPQCTVLSLSYGAPENSFFNANINNLMVDCAIQGITVCAGSGDWGASSGVDNNIIALFPASHPCCLGVGGTVLGANSGTVSSSNFVEWCWNQGIYYNVTGGGVSVIFPQPQYQNFTMPSTLTNAPGRTLPAGAPGRGVPDVAAIADTGCGVKYGVATGQDDTSGGTSASAPITASLIACINKSVGYNIGFVNPTIYKNISTVIRQLDSGGPTNNTFTNTNFTQSGVLEPGYPVNIGAWSANVGLGMLQGTSLASVLAGGETASILDISLSNNSVTGTPSQPKSVPSGTTIGTLSTTLSKGSNAVTYSVGGTNANSFQILNGNNLCTLGTVNVGTYSVNVLATSSGLLNSPFTKPETITVVANSPNILSITLSTTTYAPNLDISNHVAIVTVAMSDGSAYIGGYTMGGPDGSSFIVGPSFNPGDSNQYLTNQVVLSNSSYSISITCSEGPSNLTQNFTLTTNAAPTVTITGITLSNTTYTQGAASGTLVGAITVQATGGTFVGSLSLSGTNASSFQLSGSNLLTQGALTAASYSINVVATQSGATGSPFTKAFIITQVAPSAVSYIVEQSSGTAGPWNSVAGSPFATLTDTVTGLTPGTSYYFRITATDTALNLAGPPTIVGPVKTVSNVAESAQGTKLTTTTGTIVDSNGGVWSLILNVTPPGSLTAGTITQNSVALTWAAPSEQIQVSHPDGTVDGTNVVELLYWNHKVYRDDANGWAFWNGTGWTAAPGDPSVSTSESANGTTVTNSSGTITDALGGTWTLGGSSSTSGTYATPGSGSVTLSGNTYTLDAAGDFEQNGILISGGSGTSAIDLFNNTIYAQDAVTGTWYTYDPSSQVFTQAASPPGNLPSSNGQQVVHNGVTDNTTSQVQELLYWNHIVYYETTSSSWFDWNGTKWVSTTNPMQQSGGTESPNGVIVNNTTNSITDANSVVWTLVTSTSSGLQVAKNGVVDSTTAQVQELLYWNHAVYQESANPNGFGITPGWWFWNGSSWVSVNGDPSGTVITWSASDKSSQITLSTDKLTCNTTAAGEEAIRSTVGYTSGKFFFEIQVTAGNGDSGVGIANAQFPLNFSNQLGGQGSATGVGYYPLLTDSIYIGSTLNAISQGTVSDSLPTVVSCAVDFGAKLIWFTSTGMRTVAGITWNNSTTANPVTGTGGISFSNISAGPYFVCANDDVGGSTFIVNFGAKSFSFAIPHGFQAWGPGIGTTTVVTANPTFSDDFASLSLYNTRNTSAGGTWEPGMWYATDGLQVGNATWCINPFNPATSFNNIYTVNNSILNIALEATPSGFAAACGNMPAVSGNIQTSVSFSQTYGYFEMRCAWPGLQGTSFDFYLMNTTSWPPELDILEIFDGIFTQTVHLNSTTSTQWANWMSTDSTVSGANLTQMHMYGVDWESDFITFYYDRVQTFQIPTPAGYNVPMVIIIDYTAGTTGDYVGQPNYASLPVSMQIDYVKVWQKRPF